MSLVNKVQGRERLSVWREHIMLSTVRVRLIYVAKQLWIAYLAGAILILFGFFWGLPDGKYHGYSFQIDETAAVISVNHISFPNFDPQFYPWGTAVFYQVYLIKTIVSLAGRIHIDDYWIYVMGRALVFASAIGAITAIFFLGRKLFDEWTGRLAAILFAVLPGFVIPAHYFKMDVPMVFWMLVSMLVLFIFISTRETKHLLLLGLLVGYTFTVKYIALALMPAAATAILLTSRRFDWKTWLIFGASLAAGIVVGEPRVFWNFGDILAAFGSLQHDALVGMPYAIGRPPAWIDFPLNVLPYALSLPVYAIACVASIWGILKIGIKWLPIWVFVVANWVLLANDNLRFMRYLLPVVPIITLLCAHLAGELRKTRIGWAVVPSFSLVILFTFVYTLSYVQVMGQTDPRIQAGKWIEQNIPTSETLPVLGGHYANLPDFPLMGYRVIQADYNIDTLQHVASPYLIESEFATRSYEETPADHPAEMNFFQFVNANYVTVAQFENSQSIFGIDSKTGEKIPQDWLHPNPRITILKRRPAVAMNVP